MKIFNDLFKDINDKSDNALILVYILPAFIFLTLIIYFNSYFYGISNFDDHVYFDYLNGIFKDGVSFAAFKSIATDFVNANWHPVTIFSLAIDYLVSNNNPLYFHIMNSIIHIVNALLVYIIFNKLSVDKTASLIAAIVFVIHPLNVETVVWISERKGLLSTLFALISIVFYIKNKFESINAYKIISIFAFSLSLLSKPTTATIPAILMLLDLTVLNNNVNITLKMLWDSFKEKLPYFVVGLGIIILSFMAQSEGGALRDISTTSIPERIESSINNTFIYISKIFLPLNLASYYPQTEKSIYLILFYAIFILSWVFIGMRFFSKTRMFVFCILFFFIQLIPMSGIFQTGSHSIANRYTYLPAISIYFILGVVLTRIESLKIRTSFISIIILLLVSISINQVKVWRSDFHMWENNAKVTDRNYNSAYYYSKLLVEAGKVDEALSFFYNTIGIKNTYLASETISNMAAVFIDYNHFIEARMILQKGVDNSFHGFGIHRQIALLDYFYFNKKQLGLKHILISLKLFPNDFYVNRLYAKILFDQKKYNEALSILSFMETIKPSKRGDRGKFKSLVKEDTDIILKAMN